MAAGECWIFDTWRQHRVLNDASASRIHLVVDTVGGGGFWQLVAKGRAHDAPLQHWWPQSLPQRVAVVAFESRNVPAVMTPWELSAHLDFLFDEALPHPKLPVLRQHAARLIQLWRGLWAQHGEASSGRASFRAAFDAFAAAVQPLSREVVLGNQMRWFDVC